MFSSGANYSKLKTNLRLAIQRLKLLEKKKTELAQKARKEISDYITAGKIERAKIRVEHIIREDYIVEAMEVTEMYCDLLLARFGLIQQLKDLDDGLSEAISSLIWVAPRMQTDVQELKIIADQLSLKYGKPYAQACSEGQVTTLSEKLKHKLSVQAPPKILVEKYLIEIAKNYNIEYEPDPQVMREAEWGIDPLINLDGSKNDGSNGGAGGGTSLPPAGFSQTLPEPGSQPFNYPSISKSDFDDNNLPNIPGDAPYKPPIPTSDSSSLEFSGSAWDEIMGKGNSPPPPYDESEHYPHVRPSAPMPSIPPDGAIPQTPPEKKPSNVDRQNFKENHQPKPSPRSKFETPVNDFSLPELPNVPDLPNVPHDPEVPNTKDDDDDIDFDDLTRRFEELKKRK